MPATRHRPSPTSLLSGERKAVLLGNAAAQHPQAAQLLALAKWIGEHTGATVGYLGEAANSVGAQLVGALPGEGGLNAGADADAADEGAAAAGCRAGARRRRCRWRRDAALAGRRPGGGADVLQGRRRRIRRRAAADRAVHRDRGQLRQRRRPPAESSTASCAPLGEARPAWKVLRVLGNLLGLPGFEHESAEEVRAEALGDAALLGDRLDNRSGGALSTVGAALRRWSASPTCRSTPPTRWCAAPHRCRHRRCARAARRSAASRCGSNWACRRATGCA